jgi:hypothetical protein
MQIHCAEFRRQLRRSAADDADKLRGEAIWEAPQAMAFFLCEGYSMSRVATAISGITDLFRGTAKPQPTAQQAASATERSFSPGPAVPRGAVPYGHGAGFRVPPGTSTGPIVADLAPQALERPAAEAKASTSPATAAAAVPVPVKAHVRNVPLVEKPLLPDLVTLDVLVAEFRRAQRISVQRVLLLGALAEKWIRQQLAERTALDRATAVKKIRAQLAAAKLEKKEARVDLYVRCYWVAVLLGGWRDDSQESRAAANELSFSALRLFPIVIERDPKSDRWRVIEKYAEAAKVLWGRAVSEHLPAAVINEELSKIVPARTLPVRKHRPVKIAFVLKLLPRLPVADFEILIACAREFQRQSLLEKSA